MWNVFSFGYIRTDNDTALVNPEQLFATVCKIMRRYEIMVLHYHTLIKYVLKMHKYILLQILNTQ